MSRRAVRLGLAVIALGLLAYDGVSSHQPVSFVPSWKVGQTWRLTMMFRQGGSSGPSSYAHSTWRFRVAGRATGNDRPLVRIEAARIGGSPPRPAYLLEIDPGDLALVNLSLIHPDKASRPGPPEGLPPGFPRGLSLLPWNGAPLPFHKLPARDYRPDIALRKETNETALQWRSHHVLLRSVFDQEIIAGRVIRRLQVVFVISDGLFKTRVLQAWEEGKPWWVGHKIWRNGRLESEAILIDS